MTAAREVLELVGNYYIHYGLLEKMLRAMDSRYDDLAQCNKHKRCRTKAQGIALALDDLFEEAGGQITADWYLQLRDKHQGLPF